jgi:hypothetical protein
MLILIENHVKVTVFFSIQEKYLSTVLNVKKPYNILSSSLGPLVILVSYK